MICGQYLHTCLENGVIIILLAYVFEIITPFQISFEKWEEREVLPEEEREEGLEDRLDEEEVQIEQERGDLLRSLEVQLRREGDRDLMSYMLRAQIQKSKYHWVG